MMTDYYDEKLLVINKAINKVYFKGLFPVTIT